MRNIVSAALIAATLITSATASHANTDENGFIIVNPEDMVWEQFSGPGSTSVVTLDGNSSQEGAYAMRIKFPPNLFSRPHVHAEDRYFVVLEGTWYMGTGPDFDTSKAIAVPAGSFVKHPAGQVHWDGAMDEEVVLQVVGFGPGSTVWEPGHEHNFGPAE